MAEPGRQARFLALGALIAFSRVAAAGAAEIAVSVAPAAKTDTTDPRIFAIRPIAGPASGGTSATVYGSNFAAGATVTIGTVAATGITVPDANRINAASPALPPGSVNDVVVTVPGKPAVTLNGAWFVRFTDVPASYLFARPIEKLRRKGITTGCGGGNYCPGDSVTRAQMAIFILRGKHGATYHPPPATGTVFDDVPKTAFGADWIEQFSSEGITSGCGVKMYCPNNSVTRGEMAVFLLRARHGSSHSPPPPTGFFGDVTTTTDFAKWIEELAGEAITSGCGNGNYCPTAPSTRGEMAVFLTKAFAGSAQDVIADDLAAGDIDYETSLLYRFYALFSDERLPARYETAASTGEDPGLFAEARQAFSDLSPQGQADLAPFLVPPDDPQSVFGTAAARDVTGSPTNAALTATQCPNPWDSLAGAHFRVHICPTVLPASDQALLSSVRTIAEGLWTPMTKTPPDGMGEPLGDCYTPPMSSERCVGGDSKIDIYIVARNQCRARNGSCWPLSSTGVAMAVDTEPYVGKGSSGYMLLARDRASNAATIKSDFAHEFFHVLQFRHNNDTSYDTGVRIDDESVFEDNWFVEASATWAEWNYVPASSPDEVHWRFEEDFQPKRSSLLTNTPSDHPYASYIWPFFVQQEKGSPSPVFQAWVAAEAASGSAGITDAVDQQHPFLANFREFAVRNWNLDLTGHPIPVLYKDLKASDGSSPAFPEDVTPPFVNVIQVTPTSPRKVKNHIRIDALSAQYDEIEIDPAVKKVVLHFDKLPETIDVDVLVGTSPPEKWERRKVDKAKGIAFCREKEKVFRVIVILSNHDKTQNTFVEKDYEVERRVSCCGEFAEALSVNASVNFSYANVGTVAETVIHADQGGNLTAVLLPVEPVGGDFITFESTSIGGTASVHDREDFEDGDSSAIDGYGAPQMGSGMLLTIDLTTCLCTFGAAPFIDITVTPPGIPGGLAGVGRVYGEGHDVRDFADVLSGSGGFPAHSQGWGTIHPGDQYLPGGLGILVFIDQANEDSSGTASVNWSFKPVLPP